MAAWCTRMRGWRSRGSGARMVSSEWRIEVRFYSLLAIHYSPTTLPLDLHVLEGNPPVVDADFRRRDPGGEHAGLGDGLHQRGDEVAVRGRGQPIILALRPGGIVDQKTIRRRVDALELADMAME